MVINYDMPSCAEDYVHRIGRTGRAGASGECRSRGQGPSGRGPGGGGAAGAASSFALPHLDAPRTSLPPRRCVHACLPGLGRLLTLWPPLRRRTRAALLCTAGAAYSFFTAANGRMARQLVQILEEASQAVPPELRQFAMTSGGPTSESAGRAAAQACVGPAPAAGAACAITGTSCVARCCRCLNPAACFRLQASARAVPAAAAAAAVAAAAALAAAATPAPMHCPSDPGAAAAAATTESAQTRFPAHPCLNLCLYPFVPRSCHPFPLLLRLVAPPSLPMSRAICEIQYSIS